MLTEIDCGCNGRNLLLAGGKFLRNGIWTTMYIYRNGFGYKGNITEMNSDRKEISQKWSLVDGKSQRNELWIQ